MDPTAFLRNAEAGQIPPVVLLHGEDLQFLEDALAAVGRTLLGDAARAGFDRDLFDGREAEVESVVNAALTLPVLAPRRLVVVRHCQALASRGSEALARYVARPNPGACLLLLADEPLGVSRDRKSPHWLLGVVGAAVVVAAGARRGRALEEWLRQRARAEGLIVSQEAARLLVQWVGEDGAALLGEARKAALAGGPDNRTVGVNEVTAVVGEHRLGDILDLTRAIERREVGLALRTLERLLATEEAMIVLAALTRDLRTAWTVCEWRERGQSTDQIARALRRPPAVVDAIAAAAATESRQTLARKLRRCWGTEWRLKSGGGAARAEMAALVVELCTS